jgi:hypothetical protein
MTISNVNRFVQAGGNGVTVVFPFNFKVFQSTDVAVVTMVTSTGVQTTPVLGVDYTVTISGDQNYSAGGNVTFTIAPLTGVRITISSLVPNLQPTDLSNQGGFYPDVINDSFDRSTIQIQQVGDIASRSLSVAQSEQGVTSLALPPIAVRANKYLAFDGGGTPMAATGTNTPGISYAGNVELTANNAGSNVARDVVFYDNLTERMRLTGATGALNVTGALTVASLGVSGAATVNSLSVTTWPVALVSAAMASGSVLQVVSASTTTFQNITTSYVATPLTVTITPKRNTSTIYLIASVSLYNASTGAIIDTKFMRFASTDVSEHVGILTQAGATNVKANVMMLGSDAPTSTSATSYTLYVKTSIVTCEFNRASSRSTLFAIEVAA